jgi:DNA-binding transcriptional regulator YiaG
MAELLGRIGWSQAFFASHLGVSTKAVFNWCNGKPNQVALRYLELVSKLVGV